MNMNRFTIDGQTCEASGVNNLTFSWVNKAEDTCTITLADGGTPRRLWTDGQRVTISFDGTPYFTGWVVTKPEDMNEGEEGAKITLEGPWYWLKRIVFGRMITGQPGIFSTVQLFLPESGVLQSPKKALMEVLNWAVTMSGSAFQIGQIDEATLPGSPPPEWVSGAYCSDLVRKITSWLPSFSFWVDYRGGVPVVNLTAAGVRKSHSFTKGIEPLSSAVIERNSRLAPSAVIVRYESAKNDSQPVAFYSADDTFPPGASPTQSGAVVLTLPEADNVGIKIAQDLYNSARLFEWSGSLSTVGQMIDLKPGDFVTVSGRPAYAGSRLLVQQVSMIAEPLQFSVSMGAPEHLGASDLLDLFWFLQNDKTAQEPEPLLTLHSFQIHSVKNPLSSPFKKDVKISPGYVDFGAGQICPKWKGQTLLNSTQKDVLKKGYKKEFWLKIQWRPDVGEFNSTNGTGGTVKTYRALSTGVIVSAEIVSEKEDNTAPFVNLRSGKVGPEGEFYFAIGSAEETNGELKVVQNRKTDLAALFIPPNYLYLLTE